MASIIVVSGQQKGDYYPLGRRTNVIGRAESLPIQILDDMVSRRHLQIRFDQPTNRYFVFDMNSRNGVYVNNQRITDETPLSDGDVIMIGATPLMFTEADFNDKQSALRYYKRVGEKLRVTRYAPSEGRKSHVPFSDDPDSTHPG